MAEAAVALLQEQVREVVLGYPDVISGSEAEFNQLAKDLDLLNSLLKETAKKMNKDHLQALEFEERRIRDVIYEVEYSLDNCLTKAIVTKARRSKLFLFVTIHSLAKEIKSIRETKIQPLFYDITKFGDMDNLGDASASASGGDQQPFIESNKDEAMNIQRRVIGFEDEEDRVTGYVMEETNHLDVIPIIGMPGLGKTVLAMKIYENPDIQYHFPTRIWVYISQKFKRRDIFLHILRQLGHPQSISELTDEDLGTTIRRSLERGKFLLVLDDVWSIDVWNQIKEVLPISNGNGKILITSRELDVGTCSSVYRKPHRLRFLNREESWRLLRCEVFDNEGDCPQELEVSSSVIALNCDGLPLTIVVIAGILKDQYGRSPHTAESEWDRVASNMIQVLEDEKARHITDVVELSYQRLEYGLRECFLFLGVFPRDFEIPAKMLCRLWISGGYILPKNKRSLEESAEENLDDLIRRSLLHAGKINRSGRVKTCRVHDIIRAFCIYKSKDTRIFDEVIKTSETGLWKRPISDMQKSNLVFYSNLSMFLSKNPKGPEVRSFMCFNREAVMLEASLSSVIPDSFPKLRILESKCIKFDRFPAKITRLFHLRYLTLYIESLEILPEPITQLWNLQSLVVETKSRSVTMKANLWKMVRLRHLETRAAIILDQKWEGEAGANLHTLQRLASESCTDAVSKKVKNLRTLGISGDLTSIFESMFLEKLDRLEKLKLVNSIKFFEKMVHSLPQKSCFPPNLKRLTLTNTLFGWQHMSALAIIDTLEVLKLKDNAFMGPYWTASHYIFPRLQILVISNADLLVWEASYQSFPRLKGLVLKNCENLNEIPEAVAGTLEYMEIDRLPESAVVSARRIMGLKEHTPFKLLVDPAINYQ